MTTEPLSPEAMKQQEEEMYKRRIILPTFLLCVLLGVSTLCAGEIIYLAQDGVSTEVDLDEFISSGQIKPTNGFAGSQKVQPGPAPSPYPHVHVWEKAMEQMGESSTTCDGIRFINGNLWVPNKKALVLWKIRIPQASLRLASEFEQNLTLSLWVDWNQDKMWGKNETMLVENLNFQEYFPTDADYIEVQYLSWFWIPYDSDFYPMSKPSTGGAPRNSKKLWVRCALSYDDPDVSADGECLFGEVEDYLVTYFNYQDVQQKFTK